MMRTKRVYAPKQVAILRGIALGKAEYWTAITEGTSGTQAAEDGERGA